MYNCVLRSRARAKDVGYAFVILTPDDIGALSEEIVGTSKEKLLKATGLTEDLCTSIDEMYQIKDGTRRFELLKMFFRFFKLRARQNALLEFGYFMGKLNRSKVSCLYTGEIELPTDMLGIGYIYFKESIKDCRDKIISELTEARYEIL